MWNVPTAASLLLAALLVVTAVRKLTHAEGVVASYLRAGVPEDRLNLLAGILLAAAAGLMIGLAVPPLGALTAACLIAYFGVAIFFHVRNHDARHLPSPVVHFSLAIIVLVLQVGNS